MSGAGGPLAAAAAPPRSLAERQARLTARLASFPTTAQRLNWLVEQSRARPPLPPEFRTEPHLVPGCLARTWFAAELREGLCHYRTDSESLIIKSIASLLCDLYSGQPAAEILAHDPGFLSEYGIDQHLTPNRRNALARIWQAIRGFAEQAVIAAPPTLKFFDAHNHLQDDRFGGRQDELLAAATATGVARMVVNGACEDDWPEVLALARRASVVLPSFGLHPWLVAERTPDWQHRLVQLLDGIPSAVGEVGLDRWILDQRQPPCHPASLAEQESCFVWQLRLAADRNLPASIHCLQAWGRLHDLLCEHPRPARGFLLHSYGGPAEMVPAFAKLGAYFSFPGYFAHERKRRLREAFRQVPPDRLLIETDAPDQLLPDLFNQHPLTDPATGKPLNHPANLTAVYRFLAEYLGESPEALARRVAGNFARLFDGL